MFPSGHRRHLFYGVSLPVWSRWRPCNATRRAPGVPLNLNEGLDNSRPCNVNSVRSVLQNHHRNSLFLVTACPELSVLVELN